MKYIHRHIESTLKKLIRSFPSLAITGPRQSGKSTLLINTLTNYNYVTLDDPLIREQALSDPLFLLDSMGERAIIDEIQLAPQLLSYVKIKIDNNREKKGRYIFTGSQQFTMIKNLGDSLAGRIALLDLLPFTVAEKKAAVPLTGTLEYYIHACLRGSYPEPVTDNSINIAAWYGSYVQTYLERDIRSLYNIGNLRDFQRFLQLIAGRCAQILNLSSFAKELGVSVPTLKNWLSILEASRIVYLLPPYYNNMGKRVTKAPKLYFLDCGLVCYLTGIKDKDHLIKGPMSGALFENFCIQETVKHFFNKGERAPLYYLRTNNGLEIDLLIEQAFKTLVPVEIKLQKTPHVSMGSNIVRFKEIFSDLVVTEGIIISLTDKSMPLQAGVSAIPFDDYLKRIAGEH
jgi:predicted AAA+ superfamily ATPase